jgi:fused signal recognition particle receptor
MFKFLKEKLKSAVNKFSKNVETEAEIAEEKEPKKKPKKEKPKKKPAKKEKKPKKKKKKESLIEKEEKVLKEEEKLAEKEEEIVEKEEEFLEEKKKEIKEEEKEDEELEKEIKGEGFFRKIFKRKDEGVVKKVAESITKIKLSKEKFNDLFWEIEVSLLENNVAVEVIEKIKADLAEELTTGKIIRKKVEDIIKDSIRKSIRELFAVGEIDLLKEAEKNRPLIIVMIGVNGSGKTTTMAKLAHFFKKHRYSVVMAAADTFRAAAIQQLEEHADNLNIKLIKHDYKSDPAAVAFDAVKHARAKKVDIVLIDSAGRLHSDDNLMQELKKLVRINNPHIKIFVGESITGNDCVEQAKIFNKMIGIYAIILAKADIDDKGVAAISVAHVTGKPILFLGTGQKYEDLEKFDAEKIMKTLEL